MVTLYQSLRAANEARQKVWDPDNIIDLKWRMNELAGEAGEFCNVLKKIVREAKGLPGSRVSRDEIGRELGDVLICLDLVAMTAGLPSMPLPELPPERFAVYDVEDFGILLDYRIGRASCAVHFHTFDTTGSFIGKPEDFQKELLSTLTDALYVAMGIARKFDLNPYRIVAEKFNITSENVGLPVLLDDTAVW